MTTTNARMQQRRDTAANWTSADPILAAGEIGLDTTSGRIKFGNGTDTWGDLPYFGGSGGAGVLLASQFATLQEALTAFVDADERVLEFDSDAEYALTETCEVAFIDGVEKLIRGNRAKINLNVDFGTPGVDWGASINLDVTGFHTTQLGADCYAFACAPAGRVRFSENRFASCFQGIRLSGGGSSAPSFTERNHFYQCDYGVYSFGDYAMFSHNYFDACSVVGLNILNGGNQNALGNIVLGNAIGIQVNDTPRGVSLDGNVINHNGTCGIYAKNIASGLDIRNNQIKANYGGANLGAGIKANKFGIYVEDSDHVHIVNNNLSVNIFSLALDGITRGKINGNEFFGLITEDVTTDHIKEIGGTNANYLIDGNTIADYLVSGSTVLATNCPGATLGTNQITD